MLYCLRAEAFLSVVEHSLVWGLHVPFGEANWIIFQCISLREEPFVLITDPRGGSADVRQGRRGDFQDYKQSRWISNGILHHTAHLSTSCSLALSRLGVKTKASVGPEREGLVWGSGTHRVGLCLHWWPYSVCSKWSSVAAILAPVFEQALASRATGVLACWPCRHGQPWRTGRHAGSIFFWALSEPPCSLSSPSPCPFFFFFFFCSIFFSAWPPARAALLAGRAGQGQATFFVSSHGTAAAGASS